MITPEIMEVLADSIAHRSLEAGGGAKNDSGGDGDLLRGEYSTIGG